MGIEWEKMDDTVPMNICDVAALWKTINLNG
jgi:hypothetical protein